MTHRIFHAFQRLAITATFFVLPRARLRNSVAEAPEPLKRCVNEITPMRDAEDLWMFGPAETDGVTHRMDMLAKDMSRLSGSLGGLRSLLSDVAATAPVMAMDEPVPAHAVMLDDDILFEGTAEIAPPRTVAALGDIAELFDDVPHARPRAAGQAYEARPQLQMPLPEDRRAA